MGRCGEIVFACCVRQTTVRRGGQSDALRGLAQRGLARLAQSRVGGLQTSGLVEVDLVERLCDEPRAARHGCARFLRLARREVVRHLAVLLHESSRGAHQPKDRHLLQPPEHHAARHHVVAFRSARRAQRPPALVLRALPRTLLGHPLLGAPHEGTADADDTRTSRRRQRDRAARVRVSRERKGGGVRQGR